MGLAWIAHPKPEIKNSLRCKLKQILSKNDND